MSGPLPTDPETWLDDLTDEEMEGFRSAVLDSMSLGEGICRVDVVTDKSGEKVFLAQRAGPIH